ncbi:ankyrin repeat domain-containing protein [Burkholderia cepacia]|uniref:ankyrin repeat domain-containing protein n=1 Tax=Burkholderia cepacia TaxID=292 RepID=UPI001CF5632D|nr:ankyrin repeat domain-containing protein [Burkholderia cepacia]MCA8354186.1 ankyrin repeat domain-containing protein [Burkholderia cepacia]
MIMGDRTIREIEDDMDYHMEQGNEGAVSELTEEIENMRDRLTKAISEGNLTDVLYFESLGFDLSEPFFLNIAAKYDKPEIIKYLFERGSDIQAEGNEALCTATRCDNLKAVQCLISLGADLHARNDFPVRNAINTNNVRLVEYFVSIGADINLALQAPKECPQVREWAEPYKKAKELKEKLDRGLNADEAKTKRSKI